MTMIGDVTPYTDLIISQHQQARNFMSVVAIRCQPYADMIAVAQAMPGLFDIDVAVGDQLDAVGEWVGISRDLSIPLTGVYFSLDTPGLGFDQGVWMGPFDPSSGVVSLDDDDYRTVLYAKIADNQWDGTIPGAYEVLAPVFPGNTIFIQDNGDKSMYVGVVGPVALTPIQNSLLTGGYLSVKPAGIRIAGYITSSIQGAPVFGFDADNSTIGGFDHGAWANIAGSA